ncbi:MAG: transcriptional regulator NrdR [Dethiobacteria bacterium]|nr:transcriptional repressor NrdR [Bacillota bacterium]
MKCVFCGALESKVVDSRLIQGGEAIRRRRECKSCEKRFTTYEKAEEIPIVVIKRDGRREVFDRNEIINGLLLAGQKRPIPLDVFNSLVDELEQELRSSYKSEIDTDEIGVLILSKLLEIDEIAYVRFASIFRQFKDINAFKEELEKVISLKKKLEGESRRDNNFERAATEQE